MRIYTHTREVDPPSSWSQTPSLPSSHPLDPSLHNCCHLDIQAFEATALLQLLVQTVWGLVAGTDACAHRAHWDSPAPPVVTPSTTHHGLTPSETHSHTHR